MGKDSGVGVIFIDLEGEWFPKDDKDSNWGSVAVPASSIACLEEVAVDATRIHLGDIGTLMVGKSKAEVRSEIQRQMVTAAVGLTLAMTKEITNHKGAIMESLEQL